ncbi:MAG: hypothetical protein JKX97_06920 [Candidatus Lindowbacteria bacterium]|nr:hypothetical protein [Candidatus Lindowbacteria bacterium]
MNTWIIAGVTSFLIVATTISCGGTSQKKASQAANIFQNTHVQFVTAWGSKGTSDGQMLFDPMYKLSPKKVNLFTNLEGKEQETGSF